MGCMCTYDTSMLFFADDFSAFDLALGLASEMCMSPSFQYLFGFRGYYFGCTCIFSNKILPSIFG